MRLPCQPPLVVLAVVASLAPCLADEPAVAPPEAIRVEGIDVVITAVREQVFSRAEPFYTAMVLYLAAFVLAVSSPYLSELLYSDLHLEVAPFAPPCRRPSSARRPPLKRPPCSTR